MLKRTQHKQQDFQLVHGLSSFIILCTKFIVGIKSNFSWISPGIITSLVIIIVETFCTGKNNTIFHVITSSAIISCQASGSCSETVQGHFLSLLSWSLGWNWNILTVLIGHIMLILVIVGQIVGHLTNYT